MGHNQKRNDQNTISQSNTQSTTPPSRSGFGISASMGATIPILQDGFGLGPNGGIRLETPFSFKLIGMECKVGTEFYGSIMLPKDSTYSSIQNPLNSAENLTIAVKNDKMYSLMNIIGNISMSPSFIPSLEIRPGLGVTLTKIGEDTKTTLSIPFNLIYYFPMDLAGFKFGINLLSQITLGHPTKDGTTSLINAGLVIKTPL